MSRYSMIVQWSDEDGLFLVTIPEFCDRIGSYQSTGCCCAIDRTCSTAF
ncbi:MAG: hypothetical protein QQW96_10250 [Tychonema bourrellyi B0820]|nr:hypothetical protein [Tychonema bourrellyi B0820]